MDEHGKIYWHSAHHEALQLELYEYEDVLEFKKEHELSKEALRMDTLVIKKIKDVQISKNIGKIFRGHNIVEYKSEKDSFSFWDYQKVLGYAFIYSALEKVQMSDITISISLTMYPRELIKTLGNERGFKIQNLGNGIHYIDGDIVPIQVLESKNLPKEENIFLHNLRSNLNSEDVFKTLQSYKERAELNDKNIFISRLAQANPKAYLEAINMFSEDLRELFLEGADKYGWLNDRDSARLLEERTRMAKKMLMIGDSFEKVAKITEIPIDTVISIASELEKIPAVV
ncbi:MAG: hypothetical protein FWC89_00305 [Defluviitaleaceae bacterium]|nr:hypothetical protein [Defluviitaleaceae bacterium]